MQQGCHHVGELPFHIEVHPNESPPPPNLMQSILSHAGRAAQHGCHAAAAPRGRCPAGPRRPSRGPRSLGGAAGGGGRRGCPGAPAGWGGGTGGAAEAAARLRFPGNAAASWPSCGGPPRGDWPARAPTVAAYAFVSPWGSIQRRDSCIAGIAGDGHGEKEQ